jgi:hypothetical protein
MHKNVQNYLQNLHKNVVCQIDMFIISLRIKLDMDSYITLIAIEREAKYRFRVVAISLFYIPQKYILIKVLCFSKIWHSIKLQWHYCRLTYETCKADSRKFRKIRMLGGPLRHGVYTKLHENPSVSSNGITGGRGQVFLYPSVESRQIISLHSSILYFEMRKIASLLS